MSVRSFSAFRMGLPVKQALRGDFLRDSAIVFGSTMAVNVLNYAIHFILSRKLGVVEYGTFASLMSAMAILGIPASFMMMVVVKFVAEFHALDDRAKIRVISQRVLLLGGLFAGAVLVLALAFRNAAAAYLHLPHAASIVAASVTLAFALLLPAVRGVLQGTQDFRALAFSMCLEAVGKIGLAVALAYPGSASPAYSPATRLRVRWRCCIPMRQCARIGTTSRRDWRSTRAG